MDNHTPGPWEVDIHGNIKCPPIGDGRKYDGLHYVASTTGLSGERVANLCGGAYRPIEESKANASLIAAAPDLLEALRELLNAPDPDEVEDATPRFRAVMKAHAAIAKATGGAR